MGRGAGVVGVDHSHSSGREPSPLYHSLYRCWVFAPDPGSIFSIDLLSYPSRG
jgi:hypothetical protein